MAKSREGFSLSEPKISGSGWKVTDVPRRFGAAPSFSSLVNGIPRENAIATSSLLRATSTRNRSDSALTTEEPTPFRPPLVS